MNGTKITLLVYLIPERFIQDFNNQFGTIHWKNPTKAKTLINQGLTDMMSGGDKGKLAEKVFALYDEMRFPNELKTNTLG
jgi:hypothetical protein